MTNLLKSEIRNVLKHLDCIDHLRGIAIIAVLLCHSLAAVYDYDFIPWGGWFRDFSKASFSDVCLFPLSFGQAGVAIFFVISGFCIHISFQQQGKEWGSFFIRRFFRVYPAYFAAVVFFTLFLSINHLESTFSNWENWRQLLTHLFFVHNFHPDTFGGINGAFWSLAIEVQLYCLYPALLILVAKFGWRKIMFVLAGCELVIRATNSLLVMLDAVDSDFGKLSQFFFCSPFCYWFSWSMGAFIADAYIKKQPLPCLKVSPIWWLVLAVMTYLVRPLSPFWFTVFAVMTAVILSRSLNAGRLNVSIPVSWLGILQKVGVWSYSIYLLHMPLLFTYFYTIKTVFLDDRFSAPVQLFFMLFTWFAILPFSILWYKCFEHPGIAIGKLVVGKYQNRGKPSSFGSIFGFIRIRHVCLVGGLSVAIIGSLWANEKYSPNNPHLDPGEANNLAWSLATSSEQANRNGELAVRLAEDACRQTQYKVTVMVGTLAAAYAEAGRFEAAVSAVKKACELAAKNGETNLLKRNQELRILYENHQPYHEPPQAK